jgi:hypothetical protein
MPGGAEQRADRHQLQSGPQAAAPADGSLFSGMYQLSNKYVD